VVKQDITQACRSFATPLPRNILEQTYGAKIHHVFFDPPPLRKLGVKDCSLELVQAAAHLNIQNSNNNVYTRSNANSSRVYNLLHRPSSQNNGEREIWEPDSPAFAEFVAQLNTEFT
jgi:hypothetical protein